MAGCKGQLEHERKEDFSQGLCTQVNAAPQWHSILDRFPKQVPVAPHLTPQCSFPTQRAIRSRCGLDIGLSPKVKYNLRGKGHWGPMSPGMM